MASLPQEIRDQIVPDSYQLLNAAIWAGATLAIVVPYRIKTIDRYLDLGLHKAVAKFTRLFIILWTVPAGIYLFYHRITLPTWLILGHLVSFGGVRPNICDNPDRVPNVDPQGDWACLPQDIKFYIASVARPEHRKYPFQDDMRVVFCLVFLALKIVLLIFPIHALRSPGLCRDRPRAAECMQQESDAKHSELSKCEASDADGAQYWC